MCTMMQKEGTRILSEPEDISILFDGQHAGVNISQGDVYNLLGQIYMENKEELIDSFLQDIPASSSSLEGDFLEINDLASELETNTSGLGSFHELNEFFDASDNLLDFSDAPIMLNEISDPIEGISMGYAESYRYNMLPEVSGYMAW